MKSSKFKSRKFVNIVNQTHIDTRFLTRYVNRYLITNLWRSYQASWTCQNDTKTASRTKYEALFSLENLMQILCKGFTLGDVNQNEVHAPNI
jgi:hypothetical protein